MKKIVYFFVLVLTVRGARAQSFTWAMNDNSIANSAGYAMAVDANNNLLVAQTFTQSNNVMGLNIRKYDVNHNLVWQQQILNNNFGYQSWFGITSDVLNNVYLTSTLQGTFVVGTYTFTGGPDMFLIKFDAAGTFQWLSRSNAAYSCGGAKVITDSQNNVYVCGEYAGNVSFGSFNPPFGAHDFIAKYNSAGQVKWVVSTGGSKGSPWGMGLKIDAKDNIYFAGGYYDWITLGNDTLKASGSTYDEDVYIAKLDTSGNVLWMRNAGGTGQEGLLGFDLDKSGNPYICGFSASPVMNFGSVSITPAGSQDMFVAKYDANGNALWARNGGLSGIHFAYHVAVDNDGIAYVNRGSVYFSKYDSLGTYLGSESVNASVNDMARDNSGCMYLTGEIGPNPTAFGPYMLNPTSQQQMYIAKYCNNAPAPNAIEEFGNESLFSIYPNPANEIISLKIAGNHEGACTVSVKNTLGQVVYSECLKDVPDAFSKPIDLHGYSKGVYVVEFGNPSQHIREVKKLVLQ